MPIVQGDLVARLSGGTANATASTSLGGAMSTASGGIITSASLNNVFLDVTGDQSAAGYIAHRCLYAQNNHGTLTWQAVKGWLSQLITSTDTEFDLALDPAAVGSDSAITLTDETDAATLTAAGVTFSRPTTKAAALSVGDIPAGSKKAFWLRLTVNSTAASLAVDSGKFRFEGDTT